MGPSAYQENAIKTRQRLWFPERNAQNIRYNLIVLLIAIIVVVFMFGIILNYLCFTVVMSKRGWGEWMKLLLCPDKWLHSDWFLGGSWFFPQEENQLDSETVEGGRNLLLCLSLSLISISSILSLSSTLLHYPSPPPQPIIALLSATFSRASFIQKVHSIQKRLWWDILPLLFCGSSFVDWKWNLYTILTTFLQLFWN